MATYDYMPGQEVVVTDAHTGQTTAGLYAYTQDDGKHVVTLPHGVTRAVDAGEVSKVPGPNGTAGGTDETPAAQTKQPKAK